MSDKEVTPFKPEDVVDSVKDRIKAEFVALIPDEAWKEMIQKEIDDWLKPRRDEFNYARNTTYSHFGLFVRGILEERTKKLAQEIIDKELKEHAWNEQNQLAVNEAVSKIIVDHAGEILVKLIGSQLQMAINNTQF